MDPNATLRDLVAAIFAKEFDEAAELAKALNDWIAGGGFKPVGDLCARWVPWERATLRNVVAYLESVIPRPKRDQHSATGLRLGDQVLQGTGSDRLRWSVVDITPEHVKLVRSFVVTGDFEFTGGVLWSLGFEEMVVRLGASHPTFAIESVKNIE